MSSKNAQPASPTKNAATGPKLPVKSLRLGRIKAAVWENESDQKKFFNVTFARVYRLGDGNWGQSTSFGAREWFAGVAKELPRSTIN